VAFAFLEPLMSEQETPVVENNEVPEIENDDDFNAGFGGEAEPTETPEPQSAEQVEGESNEPAEPEVAPEPKIAVLTEDDVRELRGKADQFDKLRRMQDTAFGKIGGIERILSQIQQQTPSGVKVEITDDLVADLKDDYPEIADAQLKVLKRFAEKLAGAQAAAPAAAQEPRAPAIDPEILVERAKREMAEETLDGTHEDWRDVIGLPDQNNVIPETEFRKWLATQDERYQTRINKAYSPAVIGKAIDDFNAYKSKAAAQASTRKARIEAAVTPRGSGGHAPSRNTDDDEFEAGFRGG
jgi:hypothetical protein